MAVDAGVKGRAFGQYIGAEKMLAGAKDARHAALQTNFHLAAQNKHPLGCTGAVELAAKTHRAGAQLVAATGKYLGQHGLRRALVQRHELFLEPGTSIGIGK